MAQRPRRNPQKPSAGPPEIFTWGVSSTPPPGTTGRFLVLLAADAKKGGASALSSVAGLKVTSTSDFESGIVPESDLGGASACLLPEIGVAVVDSPPDQINALMAGGDSDILAVEPERINYPISELHGLLTGAPPEYSMMNYLRGYRDAVNTLYDKLSGAADADLAPTEIPSFVETENTWGLQATRVPGSRFSGKGIRVAVLDTGLDLAHPDFAGRSVTAQSFIQGVTAQDGHGHGTHLHRDGLRPRLPGRLPRYGIAFEAEILAGKVLPDQGGGGDLGILNGIQWAITNQADIISMSLGALVSVNQSFSPVYEQVAKRALELGTVIIAAAGNDSGRPQRVAPVSHPANCPSILAVAALDRDWRVAWFSNSGLNPQGGQVDIAGPGVDVRSSWPRPDLYNTISGTSMATPHVAGIAALYAQSDPGYRGRALLNIVCQSAKRLPLPASDVGAGLVQAL
jgi:subtilisin